MNIDEGVKVTEMYRVSLEGVETNWSINDNRSMVSIACLAVIEYWGGEVPQDYGYAANAFRKIRELNQKHSLGIVGDGDGLVALELVYYATHGAWKGSVESFNTESYVAQTFRVKQ